MQVIYVIDNVIDSENHVYKVKTKCSVRVNKCLEMDFENKLLE